MEDYINGCYTKYGTRPLKKEEICYTSVLSNGMWCVIGVIPIKEDGLSIDVYKDADLKELLFMEHGIRTNIKPKTKSDFEFIKNLAENRLKEMALI